MKRNFHQNQQDQLYNQFFSRERIWKIQGKHFKESFEVFLSNLIEKPLLLIFMVSISIYTNFFIKNIYMHLKNRMLLPPLLRIYSSRPFRFSMW